MQKVRIAIDAMGGDYAPLEIVKGGIEAAKTLDCKIILVGKKEQIEKIALENHSCCTDNIEILDAPDDIAMDEKNPARAVRKSPGSSIYIANKLVADGKADAVIAAGHTGAATAASLLILKRISGFERPCICTIIPTTKSRMYLIDGGSNIETSAEQMLQSALIGKLLAGLVLNKENPRIGLLNVGSEEGKGTDKYQLAYSLLQQESSLNFIGNVEGKTIIDDTCDVAVCDGFTGNIHLKALEGGLKAMSEGLKQAINNGGALAKLGGLILKNSGVFNKLRDHFHPDSYGGALLGGLNGISLISHGSSSAEAIKNACKQAKLLVEKNILEDIKNSL